MVTVSGLIRWDSEATPKDVRAKSQETQNLKLWFVAQPATEQCSLKTVTLT